MKLALALPAGLILATSTARAESPAPLPAMIGAEGLPYGTGQGEANWEIDASGSVTLVTMACPQCRNPNPRRREFTTDPANFARIDSLLPPGTFERALAAPCALPHANAGWLDRVELVERHFMVESHRETFRECRSPEMDDLFARLNQATAIILEIAPKPDRGPEEP